MILSILIFLSHFLFCHKIKPQLLKRVWTTPRQQRQERDVR